MEVVALNERLRGDFSALLKLLPPPYAVTTLSTIKSVISPSSPSVSGPPTDRYTQHCRFMLWRLNSYQYGSASAFLLDLEQLERAAESAEIKQRVQSLLQQVAASESEKQGQESDVKTYRSGKADVSLSLSCGVPGLQEVAPIGSEEEDTEREPRWRCNVSLKHQIVTIGTYKTREEALIGYEEQRKKMADNAAAFAKLKQLAAKEETEQREEDERVLKEAVAQCHPRLTSLKASALAASAASANNAALSATVVARAIPRSVAKIIAAASSPAASPAPSEAGGSPSRPAKSKRQKEESTTAPAKRQRMDSSNSVASTVSSTAGRSYLKLRRLIQKRLCRHLKGKEVCVLSNTSERSEGRLRASGRLEAGKVFSFRRKKQLSFANYVQDELGRAESACAHMFLVRTNESIDDHLKVCDAFSDREREQGPGSLSQAGRSRKTSRRTR